VLGGGGLASLDNLPFALRLRRMGRPAMLTQPLFCFVLFEELSCFVEIVDDAVDGYLIFPGVFRDGDDAVDAVAALADGLNEKIDIYHG
jgi:hypothetical protein